MRVSIIIPCYQQGIYLNRAIESICEQDYLDIEVIIVDDGSTVPVTIPDAKYPFPIKLVRQSNQGLSSARNTGLYYSSGELIKFLDADDKLLPNCISTQVASFNSVHPTISIIGFIEQDEDTGIQASIIPAFGDPLSALMMDNLAPIHSYVFPKSAFDDVGVFETGSLVTNGCEDYDLVFRMAIAGYRFQTLHQQGVVYFRRLGSMSKNKIGMQESRADVWLLNVISLLENKSETAIPYMLPILSGLLKISKWLNEKQLVLAKKIIMLCKAFIIKCPENIPKAELRIFHNLVSTIELFAPICDLLQNTIQQKNGAQIHINSTELNDYKLFLNGLQNNIADDWIVRILTHARNCNGDIAIYGAGEYGIRIMRICNAAGFTIKYFFDKSAGNIAMSTGVPIYHPDEIKNKGVNLIIIASVAFYDEIYGDIKHNSCFII